MIVKERNSHENDDSWPNFSAGLSMLNDQIIREDLSIQVTYVDPLSYDGNNTNIIIIREI